MIIYRKEMQQRISALKLTDQFFFPKIVLLTTECNEDHPSRPSGMTVGLFIPGMMFR